MHACPHPGATSQRCLGGTTVVAGLQRRLSEAARCSHRAAAHALARPPVPCEKVCLRITSVSYWQSLMGWCETNHDSGAFAYVLACLAALHMTMCTRTLCGLFQVYECLNGSPQDI